MHDILTMKSLNKNLNDWTYTDYFYRLMLLARSVFKWNNLPNGLDEKWIEKFLFADGNCLFYKDETYGYMVAKCTDSGVLNPYDEPTKVTPYGTGYMGKPLENNIDCVIIRNNDIMLPTSPTLQLYAYRLANIKRTIDVNVNAQKTPKVVKCSNKQRLSMKKVVDQMEDNAITIYGDNNLETEEIKVLDINAPIVFDKLQIQFNDTWNEAMTFIGLNNANTDKRERLIVNEVDANNQQIEASAQVFLKARERACEQINKIFGLNISVEMRTDLTPEIVKGGVDID